MFAAMHIIDDALLAFRVHTACCQYTVLCDVACADSSYLLPRRVRFVKIVNCGVLHRERMKIPFPFKNFICFRVEHYFLMNVQISLNKAAELN